MKIIIFLLIVLLLNGCEHKTFENFVIETYSNEKHTTEIYNIFINNYNMITENIFIIIDNYKNLNTLDDNPVFNNKVSVEMSMDYAQFESFYAQISTDLKKVNNIYETIKYDELLKTIKPLYESYNKAFVFYQKYGYEDFFKYSILHRDFIICYVDFKNKYMDFADELFKIYDINKYDDIFFMDEVGLYIHSRVSKIVVATDDLIADQKNAKEQIVYIKKELDYLKRIDNNQIESYFANKPQKDNYSIILKKMKQIERLINSIDKSSNIKAITDELTNINTVIKKLYNL